MSDETKSEGFRFLDLPPELRNRVYSYVVEDYAEDAIDMDRAIAHAPHPAVTAVCHRIREEVLLLYQKALEEFWAGHTFRLFNSWPSSKSELDHLLRESRRLASFNFPWTPNTYTGGAQWAFKINLDEHVRFNNRIIVSLKEQSVNTGFLGRRLRDSVCDVIKFGTLCDRRDAVRQGGLDVTQAVRTIFNALSVFAR